MRYYLVLLIFGTGTFLSLISFPAAAALFIWTDIFQPVAFARITSTFQFAWFVLIVLVTSYTLSVIRGKIRPRLNFYMLFIPIYLIWILISTLHSIYADAMAGFITIIKYIAPLMLISSGLNTTKQVKLLTLTMALSVGVWSAQAGIHGLIVGVSKDMGILGGQMTDNNDFMAATVSILPVLVYLAVSYIGPYRIGIRSFGFVMVALSIAAIVFSNSRGAALGLLAVIILYAVFVSKKKIRDTIVFFLLIGCTLFFLPKSFWDRMNTIDISSEQTEGSAAERLYMLKATAEAVADNPIFGVGPGCWLMAAEGLTGKKLEPHNIWLKLAAEIGIPGVLFYLFMPGFTIFGLLRVRKKAIAAKDFDRANLCVALVMAILGYLMPSTFLSHPFSEFLWAWYGIGCALVVILNRHFAARKKLGGLPLSTPIN